MKKEEVRNEIECLDDSVINAIIECCKELFCNGVPLYEWDKDIALEHLDKALADWE